MRYTSWMNGQPDSWSLAQGGLCVNAYYYYYYWDNDLCSDEQCFICEYETVMPIGYIGDGYNCSGYFVHLSL